MAANARKNELKAFLRARRAAIRPDPESLRSGDRRLTPGLRREEVAALAGVGLTWYTWLEQGRDINVSGETLQRIARALELTATDEAYLYSLAGLTAPSTPPIDTPPPEPVQLLLDGFTAGPAMVFGPTMNVLAYNAAADRVYSFGACTGPFCNNHLWRGVMDPARRKLYVTWEESIRNFIGLFRLHAAAYVGQPEYEELTAALCGSDAEFARIWNERETRPRHARELGLNHPVLGQLRLHSARLMLDGFAGLIFFLPPADAETKAAFAR
jgi:transcriptional regulator with XRE-family HTH domain